MAVEKYVIVSTDTADLTIYGGPLMWGGVTPLALGPGRQLITAEAARSGGYTFPAQPPGELNTATLRERASTALDANRTFLALAAPTNAQVVAQVQRLTRECSALIRLVLGATDSTDGT